MKLLLAFFCEPELGSASNRVVPDEWSWLSLVGQSWAPLPIGFFLGSGLGLLWPELGSASDRVFPGKCSWLSLVGQS